MLAKSPADRFGSLAEMLHALGVAEPELVHQVTTHIIKLAKSGAASRPKISQPISPTPLRSSNQSRPAPTPSLAPSTGAPSEGGHSPTPQHNRSFGRMLIAANGVIAVLVLAIWMASRNTGREPPRAVNPAPSTATDSVRPVVPVTTTPNASVGLGDRSEPPRVTDKPGDRAATAARASSPAPKTNGVTPAARDSLPRVVPSTAALVDSSSMASPAVPPPVPVPVRNAVVLIGSHIPDALLYINKTIHQIAGRRLQWFTLAPGSYRLVVTAEGCPAPFDTVVVLAAGDSLPLNYKDPKCH
jgi:hypothetical protein